MTVNKLREALQKLREECQKLSEQLRDAKQNYKDIHEANKTICPHCGFPVCKGSGYYHTPDDCFENRGKP